MPDGHRPVPVTGSRSGRTAWSWAARTPAAVPF